MNISRESFLHFKNNPIFKGKIISDSMSPVIQVGETITVEVGQKNLKRFDIIVFYDDEKLICHYLWRMNLLVTPILLQTRCLSGGMDIPMTFDNYLGKVVSHQLSLWWKLKILLKQIF